MANNLLTDIQLKLARKPEYRPIYRARENREVEENERPPRFNDLAVLGGLKNLEQAIFLRLLTPRGELAPLGHPEYGSRLPELIGRENTETTRNLVKLFILEALQQEPRLQPNIEISVTPADANPPAVGKGGRNVAYISAVVVHITAKVVGQTDTVVIGPFTLELGS